MNWNVFGYCFEWLKDDQVGQDGQGGQGGQCGQGGHGVGG